MAQGAILGQPILPQIADQYEVSLERQVAPRQVAKVSDYTKTDKNQIDVGLLIPGTQIGAYTAVNFQQGHVKGLECSYDLLPARNNHGWSGFVAYTNSLAKPTGLDNTGAPVPTYNDHDQRNTVTAGAAYAWHSGLTAAADFYYGTGTTSSVRLPGRAADATYAGQLFALDRSPSLWASRLWVGRGKRVRQPAGHQLRLGLQRHAVPARTQHHAVRLCAFLMHHTREGARSAPSANSKER